MLILIVEDEWLVAMDLHAILEGGGHAVLGTATSSAAALDLLARGCPDLVLLDINLADGKGAGIRLARRIRQRWNLPVLFVSAQAAEARENSGNALGCLSKPYDPRSLLASVETARRVLRGEAATALPAGLDLFGRPTGPGGSA